VSVAAIKIANIEKAIKGKQLNTKAELKRTLPLEVHEFILLFLFREAERLPLYRPGIDMRIEVQRKADGTLEALL